MMTPEIQNHPEYISIREAATIMSCSPQRVYQFIREGRLPAKKIGRMLIVPVKEVHQFKRTPAGRKRTKAPPWHIYQSENVFLATIIRVPIRDGLRERFLAKLDTLSARKHTFRGSMARYIMTDAQTVDILLIWKESELPNDTIRQQDIRAFQKEFSELLDWENAQYSAKDVRMHT